MFQGVVNRIFWNLEYIFLFPLTPLGRRRAGWLAVGRDETVALSTKSLRKCLHIQKWCVKSRRFSWYKFGKKRPVSFSVNWQLVSCNHSCPISWDKAFSREFACPIVYKSTCCCWIVSLSPHWKILNIISVGFASSWVRDSLGVRGVGRAVSWAVFTAQVGPHPTCSRPNSPRAQLYTKKKEKKIRLQMTISSCLYLYQKKNCLVAILHDTQQSAIWQLNMSRNLANVDNISCPYRYHNTLLWCCFDIKNSIFYTSFMLHSFYIPIYWNFVLMLCTTLIWTIEMIVFNITAILETNHTIVTGANFKTRNLKSEIKIYLNLD